MSESRGGLSTRVLDPRAVTILTTNNCTAACSHCCMHSSPDRRETLSREQLLTIIDALFEETAIELVVFAGGEPLLLGDDLLAAIARVKEKGALTRIVTNGFWARTPEAAHETLRSLRDAGLDEVNISTDDYHLPFVSLRRVKTAYEAALAIDFSAVVIANCFGPESALTPEAVHREFGMGEDAQYRYSDDGNVSLNVEIKRNNQLGVLSNARVQMLGRGEQTMSPDELHPVDVNDVSDAIGGCPWAVRSAAISPRGHLLSCCGFELDGNPVLDYGDLAEVSVKEALDRADDDVLTNMIALLGPPRIKQILESICPDELDFPRPLYTSYCEVCSDLVHRPKNQQAMMRHQGAFVPAILTARGMLRERFTEADGRVRIPPSYMVRLTTSVESTRATETGPTEPAAPLVGEPAG